MAVSMRSLASPFGSRSVSGRGNALVAFATEADAPKVVYTMAGPKPERFKVASGQLGGVAAASLPLLTRGGAGALVAGYSPKLVDATDGTYSVLTTGGKMLQESSKISSFNRPAEPLILYEFDGCPFCKKVREMASYLDLDVLHKPCPQGGKIYRPECVARGGKSSFPYMVDPNTGTEMYESDAIIKYMADTYGDGTVPIMLRLGVLTVMTAGIGMIPRMGKGSRRREAKQPEQPLILWGYEPSPFVRLTKEVMNELELPHIFKSAARGSPKRQEMFDEFGTFQVPLLQDPNTGVAMFESSAILEYLEETYAMKA